jgi:hypothetical protein
MLKINPFVQPSRAKTCHARNRSSARAYIFSYLPAEERVREDPSAAGHDGRDFAGDVGGMYSKRGRPSIPPKKLLRAHLLQMLYSVRSERLLMEEIDYSMLFRRFVGLDLDEEMCDATEEFLLRVGKRARD